MPLVNFCLFTKTLPWHDHFRFAQYLRKCHKAEVFGYDESLWAFPLSILISMFCPYVLWLSFFYFDFMFRFDLLQLYLLSSSSLLRFFQFVQTKRNIYIHSSFFFYNYDTMMYNNIYITETRGVTCRPGLTLRAASPSPLPKVQTNTRAHPRLHPPPCLPHPHLHPCPHLCAPRWWHPVVTPHSFLDWPRSGSRTFRTWFERDFKPEVWGSGLVEYMNLNLLVGSGEHRPNSNLTSLKPKLWQPKQYISRNI